MSDSEFFQKEFSAGCPHLSELSCPSSLILITTLATCLALLTGCSTLAPPENIAPGLAAQSSGFSQSQFTDVLNRHVNGQGQVNYEALVIDPLPLDAYYARLAEVSPDRNPDIFPTRDEALAYWLNAYNASAIALVVAHYPIASVKDVRPAALFFLPKLTGFFVLEHVVLGGAKLNLRSLEDRIIRNRFKEPRIHFALSCGARSSPRLRRRAFEASTLSLQLEAATYFFIREPRNVEISPDEGKIRLSPIFKLYRDDFLEWVKTNRPDQTATLLTYIAPYLDAKQATALAQCRDCRIEFQEFDWGLNDQPASGTDR